LLEFVENPYASHNKCIGNYLQTYEARKYYSSNCGTYFKTIKTINYKNYIVLSFSK